MAETTSISFPNMFNITTNQVNVIENTASVANRTRLLILTEPTELYNNPDFGVGLKSHLWKYNTEAERGVVKDKIIQQLRLHEPSVYPDKTHFSDKLLSAGGVAADMTGNDNTMALTVAMQTIFKDEASVTINSDAQST